jgi:hypothetical protein
VPLDVVRERAEAVDRQADVEMVVVVRERLNDSGRSREAGVRADEDANRAGRDEPVDEVLGERAVDLRGPSGRALPAVEPRVVDVDVEAVLVRDVAWEAVARAEVAAAGATHVADAYARCVRMRGRIFVEHLEERPHEPVVPPASPAAVRRAPQDRVPGEEGAALGR